MFFGPIPFNTVESCGLYSVFVDNSKECLDTINKAANVTLVYHYTQASLRYSIFHIHVAYPHAYFHLNTGNVLKTDCDTLHQRATTQ